MSSKCFSRLQKVINSGIISKSYICSITTCKVFLTKNAVHSNIGIHEKHEPSEITQENEAVLDIYRERLKYSPLLEEEEAEDNLFLGLNLAHGLFGVFDIEDLVESLQHQNAEDIFVASVPKEIKYVDYIVVVSGKSQRHMLAIAQFIRRVYKHKRDSNDIVPKLEGENSPDWMAMDLGNIALHIFSKKARIKYDLDSLWAVGPKYDEECNKKEPISDILEKHSWSLKGLEPAS